MIKANEIVPVATVNKTHGIHGELSVTVDPDVELDHGSCVIARIDGLFVPFFISAIRPRTSDTFLITLEDVDSDTEAAAFVGQELYVRAADIKALPGEAGDEADDEEPDGLYASALIGSTLADTDGTTVGVIEGIDTTTVNTILIVERPDGSSVMVPLAEDLIDGYDRATSTLTMNIPAGLLDL